MAFSDLDLDKMQVERSSPLRSSWTQQEQKKEPPTWAGSSRGDGGAPGKAGVTLEL